MTGYLSHVAFVLYQPQDVVNVASIVRVMSNFGLPWLRLVEPAAFDPYRIEGIAHNTRRIVASARRFGSLEEALSDCRLVLGTTGRPRHGDRRVLTPRQAAPLLAAAGEGPAGDGPGPVAAVLFGPEQDGLPHTAIDLCHGLIMIPTHPENRSLNLAQAALVVAYELWMAREQAPAAPGEALPPVRATAFDAADLATGRERTALFAALEDLLLALYPDTASGRLESSMSRLRTLFMRAAPVPAEARAMANLCRHAARTIRGVPDPRLARDQRPDRGG